MIEKRRTTILEAENAEKIWQQDFGAARNADMKLCVRRWIEHDFPVCNHYDLPGSQVDNERLGCTFCDIAAGKSEPLLYEDEHCAIFSASS